MSHHTLGVGRNRRLIAVSVLSLRSCCQTNIYNNIPCECFHAPLFCSWSLTARHY